MRYDSFVSKRLKISRNKALELIEKEQLSLNSLHFKPSFNVANYLLSLDKNLKNADDILENKLLSLELREKIYVSRAAFKLKGFLEELNLDIKDKFALTSVLQRAVL